ncbi:probable LRR receptor-like serine/threonine-protein kinase At5g48740 [Impatiens glandulifera]|uniref:probable LRR receptor-like serine/threonine-protein kinase At5g48740 n=1 Tax=Impatiens glandulifera TaxID=253017 RepID=UPI001FB0D8B7|nr:probable LRR receptor-like serine/threonine-protein kinase At5g48740 [Impatiens glandulifera]
MVILYVTDCGLNFSTLPYEPTGDCILHEVKVDLWGIISSKICCQNALSVFSQALSIRIKNNSNENGSVFLDEDQWKKCNQPFIQPSVSISSCGFDNLFNGSSKCSSKSFSAFKQLGGYKDALQKCSQVKANVSFDATCGECNAAISDMKNGLLDDLNVDNNGVEKAGCGVAIVISIAVGRLLNDGNSSNDDFYRCLSASNQFDAGYIKIKSALAKEALAVLIAICGIALIILLIKYVTRSKRKETKPSNGKHKSGWSSFYQFSKEEIENAIVNGKACLGRGSAGQVFKGILPSGQIVAIKQIYRSNASDTFEREVNGLMRVKHKNLVSLVGYCMGDSEQYLVYEYCSAGNLAQHLLGKDKNLDWETRVRILRDCAVGLRFLHHHTDGCIVHRDIKLTNILLTKVQKDLEPKLSDFGLAKMLQIEHSKVYTDVRGTIGYMDPEYMSNAKLTCASDVYSFGIVTLQLLSGQQVIQLDLAARDQLTTKVIACLM